MGKKANIGRYGQPISETIAFPDDATVNDVLAHFKEHIVKGETLHIDGDSVEGDYEFENDGEQATTIYIVPNTTGA